MPQATNADFANTTNASYVVKASNEDKKIVKTVKVIATAYSSSWDETTGIPGVPGIVTASGKSVAPEIIANNGLPFGTEVRFPKLFRDKVFIVGDRLNERYGPDRVDFFMQSKQLAINFGVKNAEMEILED
jgi:3D (Asp-Asp-Asp) domain-containing protein